MWVLSARVFIYQWFKACLAVNWQLRNINKSYPELFNRHFYFVFSDTDIPAKLSTGDKSCQKECESCCKIRNTHTAADVVHGKTGSSVCVNCALTEHHLQGRAGDKKKKIKVLEILRPCVKCQSDKPRAGWCFCRECQQHYCDSCKGTDEHCCSGDQVSRKYDVLPTCSYFIHFLDYVTISKSYNHNQTAY